MKKIIYITLILLVFNSYSKAREDERITQAINLKKQEYRDDQCPSNCQECCYDPNMGLYYCCEDK